MTATTTCPPVLYNWEGTALCMGRDSLIPDLGEWSGNETTLATGMSNLHVPCSDLQNGDEFMNRIQDLAGYLPYMTCPGNHG